MGPGPESPVCVQRSGRRRSAIVRPPSTTDTRASCSAMPASARSHGSSITSGTSAGTQRVIVWPSASSHG